MVAAQRLNGPRAVVNGGHNVAEPRNDVLKRRHDVVMCCFSGSLAFAAVTGGRRGWRGWIRRG
jgi:hypothetical protein